ncbi:PLAT domain-containing protein 3-like [Cornus florida]|uniref:PLAT domain-containing protein 3-like n=1 Tax=Cornus florida TaxID=4283 RepID=UPI002896A5CF|nr:PLAT domain-containing protein 3-like [Cornus florida]
MGKINRLWFQLFIVLSVATIARSDDDCVYTVYVRTGSIFKGGTDSKISVTLYDTNGWGIRIPNLEAWGGLMGPEYNYFERGNLDIFSGRGPCLTGSMCSMNLTSDGSGDHHGWYCNYVEVTSTGAHIPCAQQLFTVEQWLALDTSPYELTAIRNNCVDGKGLDGDRNMIKGSDASVVSVM